MSEPRDDACSVPRLQKEAARRLAELFGVHRACAKRPCRRARACMGDPAACYGAFFRSLPDDQRAWWQQAFRARAQGLDAKAAAKLADETMAKHVQVTARFDGTSSGHSGARAASAFTPVSDVSRLASPESIRRSASGHGETGVMDSGPAPGGASRNDIPGQWAESHSSGPSGQATDASPPRGGGSKALSTPKIRLM